MPLPRHLFCLARLDKPFSSSQQTCSIYAVFILQIGSVSPQIRSLSSLYNETKR